MFLLRLLVVVTVLLSNGANSQVGEGRVDDLLSMSARAWREDYIRLLESPSTDALSQCGPFIAGRQCAVSGNTVQTTLREKADYLRSPVRS